MDDKLTAYKDVGQAIRNKIPFVLLKPTIDDLIEGTNVRMYNLRVDDPTALTDSSLSNFLKALASYKKSDNDRRDEEAKVCHLILTSLSEEARMHLRSVPAFQKAVDDSDSYAMYMIAKEEHSRSSSFAVAQNVFQQLLNIKMDGTFSKLAHDLTDHRRKFDAIFDKAATGTVRTDDIWVMLLMNALPDEQFLFMKETLYSKDLKEAFPKYAVVLQDMQNYDLNRKKPAAKQASSAVPAAKQEFTAPVGPTILSATTTIPSTTKCLTCSKIFTTVMKKNDPGEFFKHCYTCSAKHREARDTATPTPAQVKKAQAVILAAQIADPIPPITQREINSINNYMDSQYYSLAATTTITTTPSQLPATRRAEPWIPDSGSTFSSTNSIKDLHRPRKLPTPIPITGANGAVIYATHVGSCRFDPRLRIYFVPQSAVKLLSLGALSSLGYSYASRHDRRLTITTPSGSTLCHCTIQPNNTWVFPSSLMFPKTSVPTRKSVPSGLIELPYRSMSHHRSVTSASSAIPAASSASSAPPAVSPTSSATPAPSSAVSSAAPAATVSSVAKTSSAAPAFSATIASCSTFSEATAATASSAAPAVSVSSAASVSSTVAVSSAASSAAAVFYRCYLHLFGYSKPAPLPFENGCTPSCSVLPMAIA